ncbi:hypothetical protein V9T40_007482 [Parthenolecanium corni]|uniref:Uncharacterized protein n=1 Tax=Parthenolecanium corni TaxID=536013 RepID=A0AAN9TVE6_9HEMI
MYGTASVQIATSITIREESMYDEYETPAGSWWLSKLSASVKAAAMKKRRRRVDDTGAGHNNESTTSTTTTNTNTRTTEHQRQISHHSALHLLPGT